MGEVLESPRVRWWRRIPALRITVAVALLALVGWEYRTSAIQAWLIASYVERLSYHVSRGQSPRIAFPSAGPFDERLGYSRIPDFDRRLETRGFQITRQARVSEEMAQLVSWGITPPYPEPGATALLLRGDGGTPLYDAAPADRHFASFDDIPPLLVRTLLFIENRELPEPKHPRSNPAIEWDRLAKAGILYTGSKLGLPLSSAGGSTLATQLEKYRHSPHGRTDSPVDKLRQVAAASLKAYRDGFDTRPWRKQIVLDYVNSMPLSAAPGYGEVHGLGAGLWAWFGLRLSDVRAALSNEAMTADKIAAYKAALALVASLPAPTTLLVSSRDSLEDRADRFTYALTNAGIIDAHFAATLRATPLRFLEQAPPPPPVRFATRKAPNAIRSEVARMLGVSSLYDLDRLHLEVASTIDVPLQNEVTELFQKLRDPGFIAANGLVGKRLLEKGDPAGVVYSLVLYEKTPEGRALRVHADNLDRPFDLNRGMKLELGSTAKLRTLAHYLELVAEVHGQIADLDARALRARREISRDPLTTFVIDAHLAAPKLTLDGMLDRALERRYSASPGESFFTGGGLHRFQNFDRNDDGKVLSLRNALRSSTNLVFIRLMRDLVRYHEARLTYDARRVLEEPDNATRLRMLGVASDVENRVALARSCRVYRGLGETGSIDRVLGGREPSLKNLTLLFHAWNPNGDAAALHDWIDPRIPGGVSEDEAQTLSERYAHLRYGLADYGYLLDVHPIELWCAGELIRHPQRTDAELYEGSAAVRRLSSEWLFKTKNFSAQNTRLRVRIEQDAFARMTPYWRRLGFPFDRLVPSYATAIGSSTDRPAALAELIGIIHAAGVRQPTVHVRGLRFAAGTPYETVFSAEQAEGDAVMNPAVARALREALAGVVDGGTARRLSGVFTGPDGRPIVAGGKTGSGDNRFKTFARGGGVTSSRAINRTATFVFYIGDRYSGVLTALVPGPEAEEYEFTSGLPVSVLKMLAPSINERLRRDGEPEMPEGAEATFARVDGEQPKNAGI